MPPDEPLAITPLPKFPGVACDRCGELLDDHTLDEAVICATSSEITP